MTPEQLWDLMRLSQHAAQIRWLERNGIEHFVRADGSPAVPSWQFTGARKASSEPRGEQPNFAALHAR